MSRTADELFAALADSRSTAKVRSPLTRSEDDRRELIVWAVACAERRLPLFGEAAPGDHRPREALAGAMAFTRGELRIGTPAATAAARACGQAAGVAHMAAHARAVPSYVLTALALAHPGDPHVLDSEDAWQRAQLPVGFAEFVYPAG